jgi:O-antigen/teichoic acid export membrane protein
MLILNINVLIEFCAFVVLVLLGYGPIGVAIGLLLSRMAGIILLSYTLHKTIPWLVFGYRFTSLTAIRKLVKPAFAMLAFPLGSALNIQGLRLIVGAMVGPTAVVLFTTLRTLARIPVQLRMMIEQIIQPEMSVAFGKNDVSLFGKIVSRASQISFWMTGMIVLVLVIFGKSILVFWTGGKVAMDWQLYVCLLLVALVNGIWSVLLTVMLSTNRHEKAAIVYMVIYGIGSSVLAYGGIYIFGLSGVGLALLITEILMTMYVVPRALSMAALDFQNWMREMFTLPYQIFTRNFWNTFGEEYKKISPRENNN